MAKFTDRHGRTIGESHKSGDREIMRDRHGKKVGEYDSKRDETRDAKGRKVGSGNQLGGFLKR